MLGLGLPERSGGRHLSDHLARPKPGGIDIGDGLQRDPLLLVAGIEDRRTVAGAAIVALAVWRRGIVDLEEKFQQLSKTDDLGIEDDLDGFGMVAVIAIGRIRNLAAAVTHPGRDHAGIAAQQILHAPEAAAGQHRAFG